MNRDEAARLFPPGTRFARYEIAHAIGVGGMGAVYEAVHLELKKRVAIKVLVPDQARDPDVRTRFLREGEAAARIRHPHIVDIHDVGEFEGLPYLVMEYLDGEDLARTFKRLGVVPLQQLVDLMLPVIAAIHAAHEEGVIHRDVKPGNIFLARTRHGKVAPKVLDFGISKVLSGLGTDELTRTSTVLGTPSYMAPEQVRASKSIDGRVDQYALGVILYQGATGQRPFNNDSMFDMQLAIVQGQFPPPRQVKPDLPPEFEAVVLRAMARDANDRFPTTAALGAALLPFAGLRARAEWAEAFGVADEFGAGEDIMTGARPRALTGPISVTADVPALRTLPPTAVAGPSATTISASSATVSSPPTMSSPATVTTLGSSIRSVTPAPSDHGGSGSAVRWLALVGVAAMALGIGVFVAARSRQATPRAAITDVAPNAAAAAQPPVAVQPAVQQQQSAVQQQPAVQQQQQAPRAIAPVVAAPQRQVQPQQVQPQQVQPQQVPQPQPQQAAAQPRIAPHQGGNAGSPRVVRPAVRRPRNNVVAPDIR